MDQPKTPKSDSKSYPKTYHDYVIRDGVFVGDFEAMYQNFDSPWHQTEPDHNVLSKSRNATLLNIKKYQIKSIAEFGCGLGYFSRMIKALGNVDVLGIDISKTAIAKAQTNFPDIRFHVDTIANLERYAACDAVLLAEITWYILPELQNIFLNLLTHFRGKYFLHNLTFYKGEAQKYGRNYFTNLDQFIEFCPFTLVERAESTTADPNGTIETSTLFKIEPKQSLPKGSPYAIF